VTLLTVVTPEVAEQTSSTGEAVAFWLLGGLSVVAALGLVLSRKAVHGALFLALVMICLAGLYVVQDAPFLGVVQVVVYTGAVMMLFLFVIMLVGVDASDSLSETLRGQRLPAALAGLGLAVLLAAGLARVTEQVPVGLAEAMPEGNVNALAELLFGRYVLAFEATAALLITAAVGATLLSHRERLVAKATQRELAIRRFRPSDGDFSNAGPLPSPGVFALNNSVDTPALLPDGSVSDKSLSRVFVARAEVEQSRESDDTGPEDTGPEDTELDDTELDDRPDDVPDAGNAQETGDTEKPETGGQA
jgi:NADH-quinone oxidoreductase subunit J